jgi:hypothetical protein
LAGQQLSAAEFLEYAAPHQLWKAKNEYQIADALQWLSALSHAWEKRQ